MSFRSNPGQVAVRRTAQGTQFFDSKNPQVKAVFEDIQNTIIGVYEDLTARQKIFNEKYNAIVDAIGKFDTDIRNVNDTLNSISEIQLAADTLITKIMSKDEVQPELNLLVKLRAKQGEKKLDIMPSIISFKSSMETIPVLIDDARTCLSTVFADHDKKFLELQNEIIICATVFQKKCLEAKAISDKRVKLRTKQESLDSVEIPQCNSKAVPLDKPRSETSDTKKQINLESQSKAKKDNDKVKQRSIFSAGDQRPSTTDGARSAYKAGKK